MIGGNPNYFNLYATKGHTHDDMLKDIKDLNKDVSILKKACITSSSEDNKASGNYWTKIARFNMNYSWAVCAGSLTFNSVEGWCFASSLRFFIRMTKDTSQNPTVRLYWQSCDGKDLENVVVLERVSNGVFDLWLKACGNWQTFYITLDSCMNPEHITLYDRQGWVDGSKIPTLDYARYQTQGTRNKSGAWWNDGAVTVGTNGVSEVGKYIDFHTSNTSTADFDVRLAGFVNTLTITGSFIPNGTNKYQLGNTENRWSYLNLVNSPNVSSDRTMKKDISYLRNKSNNLSYDELYNFVKDDLELSTYKFKEGDDKDKLGFIAQDLLYNVDESDNKVGQFIVNPISVDEEETLNYDMGNYINVLAGALKVSINKIEELTNRVETLEQTVNQLLDKVNSDL